MRAAIETRIRLTGRASFLLAPMTCLGLGGVTGGVFGTSVLRTWITVLTPAQWMWVCAGGVVLIAGLAWRAGRIVDREQASAAPPPVATPQESPEKPSLFDGLRLIRNSPCLLSIIVLVGVYEVISSVMDFQFSATVSHYLNGPAIEEHFATVFLITNVVAMSLGITLVFTDYSTVHLLALVTIPLGIVWVVAARYAGRRFKEMTETARG